MKDRLVALPPPPAPSPLPVLGYLERLITETEFFGFPCVLSTESQLLAGFITRKDIQTVIGTVSP